MKRVTRHGLGWQPDLPDFRDYTPKTKAIKAILDKSRPLKAYAAALPKSVDLAQWCSPIENQGDLGSCTAQAGVALFEFYQRRAYGRHLDGSRLFLYKATRNLLGLEGDTGAYLRSTMGAMALFGIPPETYWPYEVEDFDVEPSAFCYSFAQNYQALKYYRLDPAGEAPKKVLENVKRFLAAHLPSMFGFTVFSSIWDDAVEASGEIPFPDVGDTVDGGHAVVAIGYDDQKKIGDRVGALKIRNSWGKGWGDQGYGWLPYDYLLQGIADDFWSLVHGEFVQTSLFAEAPAGAAAQRRSRGAKEKAASS